MKKKYFMLAALLVVLVVISLNVYAEKEYKAGKVKLPEAVATAVQQLYPKADIQEAGQAEEGVDVYEIEVVKDGAEFKLTITPDGTVVEEEQEVDVKDLPQAVQDAIAGSEVKEVSREVTHWAITLTKLDVPQTSYSVEMKQNGQAGEIEFAPDGTVIKQEMSGDDEGDEEHEQHGMNNNGDDDDGEEDDD